MCFEPQDRPPIPPTASSPADLTRSTLSAADGNVFAVAIARAAHSDMPGVVIVPDVRGLHGYYADLAARFAGVGVDAVAIDPYGRTAGATERDEAFDHGPHREAARDATLGLDVDAACDYLRQDGVQTVIAVGFCFGGRAALMQASRSVVDGAVGFYGWPTREEAGGSSPIAEAEAGRIRAPVLAIFGGDDRKITDDDIARYDVALAASGVECEIIVYPGAPHSFFDRKAAEHAEACADAWRRMLAFIERPGKRAVRRKGER